MDRYLSPTIFSADFSSSNPKPTRTHRMGRARDVGFDEIWLQAAIESDPELVIAPCREGELTDEEWVFWAREFPVEPGSIDVLLLSESGRIAIIETKLSYNPEGRRSVLAQVLEYSIHLPTVELSRLPAIPLVDGREFVDTETVHSRVQEADYLLIIAGDRLDSRAVKLSQSLLGRHLIRGWDLALVEVAVFEDLRVTERPEHLLVPHLRGALKPERRQVVRVIVEGDRTRVQVDPAAPIAVNSERQRWDEASVYAEFDRPSVPSSFREVAHELRNMAHRYPTVSIGFGSGRYATVILRNRESNILEFSSNGIVRFRPGYFQEALGEELGRYYRTRLETIFPVAMKMTYPFTKLDPPAERETSELLTLIDEVLTKAGTLEGPSGPKL